jgi:hypothetical protein
MSLEYYLFSRRQYSDIIKSVDEILGKYELMCVLTTAEGAALERDYYDTFKPHENKHLFTEKLRHVQKCKKICEQKILELCRHVYVTDYIDITPDRSEQITYCSVCEHTK